MTDALDYLMETVPPLFERGVQALRSRAAAEPKMRALLDDIVGASGTALLRITGRGDLWFTTVEGALSATRKRPDAPALIAIEVDGEVLDVAIEEAKKSDAVSSPEVALGIARLASARAQALLGGESLPFVLTVRDTPDFERVEVRVGLGMSEPPATPRFTAECRYDDLVRASRGEFAPKQFFLGGKMKLGGDYSRALELALKLASPPPR